MAQDGHMDRTIKPIKEQAAASFQSGPRGDDVINQQDFLVMEVRS
jgi:hypothetical protein